MKLPRLSKILIIRLALMAIFIGSIFVHQPLTKMYGSDVSQFVTAALVLISVVWFIVTFLTGKNNNFPDA